MNEVIKLKIQEIEEKENVRILHAIESGSRAWGFASPDSDYDVRFIYVRQKEFYLRLDKTRDVIEWQLDDTLDISGWDISKALALMYKSNPTLFEWNASPVVYKTSDEWKRIAALANKYFVAKSSLYHYMSMAKGNRSRWLKGETVKHKKYFYVLRPLLACKWILEEGTPPPVLFDTLMDKYLDECVMAEVMELLELKVSKPEIAEGKRFEKIDEYIDRSITEIEEKIKDVPSIHDRAWDELNEMFLSLLQNEN